MSNKKDNENGSFWTTVPGVITAIAALITAIVGLIAVFSPEDPPPPSIPVSPSTFNSVPPTVISPAAPKRNTSIHIEAENGKLGNGAYVENNSTASKNSFVNFGGEGTVKFTLDNMEAGQYTVVIHYIKYANNTATYPDTGFQNLYVNNNPNPISIYYTKTFGDGGSVTWSDTSITIALEDGTNTLLISVIPGVVGGSVDYIYVSIN